MPTVSIELKYPLADLDYRGQRELSACQPSRHCGLLAH